MLVSPKSDLSRRNHLKADEGNVLIGICFFLTLRGSKHNPHSACHTTLGSSGCAGRMLALSRRSGRYALRARSSNAVPPSANNSSVPGSGTASVVILRKGALPGFAGVLPGSAMLKLKLELIPLPP